MNQHPDILSEPWSFGLTNRSVVKITTSIDCALLLAGFILFLRNTMLVSGAMSFILVNFLVLLTSSFQCILAMMTLKRMRFNQNFAFFKHYVNMKLIHLVFFLAENGLYVPIICRDAEFVDEYPDVCDYMGLGVSIIVLWFALQAVLLAIIGRISVLGNRDPRFQQRRVIIDNAYQQPTAEESNREAEPDKSVGIVVECEGLPFSLVNSGPLPFKIVESVPLVKKRVLRRQEKEAKDQAYQIEQVDIRYLVMSNTVSPPPRESEVPYKTQSQIANRRRFEDQPDMTAHKPRRLGDIEIVAHSQLEYKGVDSSLDINKMEEYAENINRTLAPEILTRSK